LCQNALGTLPFRDFHFKQLIAHLQVAGSFLYALLKFSVRLAQRFLGTLALRNIVMNNSTAMISVADLQGRYMLVKHGYERLFHAKSEFLVGKTVYDLLPREHTDTIRASDQRVLDSGIVLEVEEVTPPRGARFCFRLRHAPQLCLEIALKLFTALPCHAWRK
jgi:PAS domain S-box-containing protein